VKLYRRKDDGRIVGTQKDAGPASNRQDFEVPTDKPNLIEFLNLNLQPEERPVTDPDHPTISVEDFSAWLHIQAEKDDLIKGLCEAVTQFKNDRRETEDMIKELDSE
jgi:hypothetical protein